jgi:hypothetical protein
MVARFRAFGLTVDFRFVESEFIGYVYGDG